MGARPRQRQRGTTLIELSIVVVVVALVLASVLLSFRQLRIARDISQSVTQTVHILATLSQLANAQDGVVSGVMAREPGGKLAMAHGVTARIAKLLGSSPLADDALELDALLSIDDPSSVRTGFYQTEPLQITLLLFAFNNSAVVLRHDTVPGYAVKELAQALQNTAAVVVAMTGAELAVDTPAVNINRLIASAKFDGAVYASGFPLQADQSSNPDDGFVDVIYFFSGQ